MEDSSLGASNEEGDSSNPDNGRLIPTRGSETPPRPSNGADPLSGYALFLIIRS